MAREEPKPTTYRFDYTWAEFQEEIHSPPAGSARSSVGDDYGYDWDLNCGFENAVKMSTDGWPEGQKKLSPIIAKVSPNVASHIKRTVWMPTVEATGALDVGVFLSGAPECWKRPKSVIVQGRGRLIHIMVNGGMNCFRESEEFWSHGAAVAALIYALEMAGCSTRVTWAESTASPSRRYYSMTYVRLKDWGSPLNLPRLTFALCHPAMLRRLWFRVAERFPADVQSNLGIGAGYGCSIGFSEQKEPVMKADIIVDHTEERNTEQIEKWVEEQLAKQGVQLTKKAGVK